MPESLPLPPLPGERCGPSLAGMWSSHADACSVLQYELRSLWSVPWEAVQGGAASLTLSTDQTGCQAHTPDARLLRSGASSSSSSPPPRLLCTPSQSPINPLEPMQSTLPSRPLSLVRGCVRPGEQEGVRVRAAAML